MAEEKEYLFKLLVVGDVATGKSSLISRYTHNTYSNNYRATLGVDFSLKLVRWDSNTVVRIQMWDVGGQETFGNFTKIYYRQAAGALVVYDITRMNTFEAVTKWKKDIDSKVCLANGKPIPVLLLANKCDLATSESNTKNKAQMDRHCQDNGFIGWVETSGKDNIGIDDAIKIMIGKFLENKPESMQAEEEDHHNSNTRVRLQQPPKQKQVCCS